MRRPRDGSRMATIDDDDDASIDGVVDGVVVGRRRWMWRMRGVADDDDDASTEFSELSCESSRRIRREGAREDAMGIVSVGRRVVGVRGCGRDVDDGDVRCAGGGGDAARRRRDDDDDGADVE